MQLSKEWKQRAEQIVREIAGRLSEPEDLLLQVKSTDPVEKLAGVPANDWSDLSLASGFPGLCLLFGELDRHYPEEGWDLAGHQHLVAVQQATQQQGINSFAMWGGLSGIVMAVQALSRGGTRYQTMIERFNQFTLAHGEAFVQGKKQKIAADLEMPDFEVMSGIAGMGRYVLNFAEQPEMRRLLEQILAYLVALCGEKTFQGQTVPAWHVAGHRQFLPIEREQYPNGNLNLGFSHGITGPLAMMSLALAQGIEVPGQQEAIRRVADWLLEWRRSDEYGTVWPRRVSLEEWSSGDVPPERLAAHQESWCYGAPGIGRALWLAGRALHEERWQQAALDAYHATFRRPNEMWNLQTPTLCHGYACLLHMGLRMRADAGVTDWDGRLQELAEHLIALYDESVLYGYDEVEMMQDQVRKISKPGLLNGSAGIALVLLELLGDSFDPEWDRVFLLV